MKRLFVLLAFLLIALPLAAQTCPGPTYAGSTRDYKFTTRAFATGVPTTGASLAITAYKSNSTTTEITTGITTTFTSGFDAVAGFVNLRVDYSADATFYAAGSDVTFMLSAGTVGGTSVVGEVICNVHIIAATAAADIPDVNIKNVNNVSASSVTAVNANLGTTQPINFTGTGASALAKSDAIDINSVAASSVTAINANLGTTQPVNFTGTGASALAKADTVDIAGAAVSTTSAQIGTNVVSYTAGQTPMRPLTTGTAQGPGTGNNQIQLASAENFTNDDQILCSLVHILSGTGKGQNKIITDYANATDTATVDSNWATNPDSTSVYQIVPWVCTVPASDFAGLVWDAAKSSYVVAGSMGKSQGDTEAAIGTPATLGGGATIAQNLQDLADDNTASFDRTTDSLQAIRDRGDAAWGGSGTIVSGTADSGTTTTMVDAARTEADTDYWRGQLIKFTSGSISGQTRYITGFNASTDTITFDPATTQAVGTNTYDILPFATLLSGAEAASSLLDASLSGHTTAGTVGKKLTDIPSIITLPKNTATSGNRISFFSVGTNGQFTTGATGVACTISLDGAAETSVTDTPAENEFGTDASTWSFDLTQAETNANQANIVCTGTGMRPAAIHLEFQQ